MPQPPPKFHRGQHPVPHEDLNEVSQQAGEARAITGSGEAVVGDSGGQPTVNVELSPQIRRFILTGVLAVDGYASANLRQWDPSTWEWDPDLGDLGEWVPRSPGIVTNEDVPFDVYDGESMYNGEVGTLGTAVYMEDAQRWEVASMQCPG